MRSFVHWPHEHWRGITVSGDSSPRSVAAVSVVRAEGQARGIPVSVEKRRDHALGVVVASRFDPRDPQPVQYAASPRARIPTATPTAAGYTAWLAANGGVVDEPTRLFAASRVAFLPKELSHGHEESGFGWYPGGTIVPVSKPLG